MNEQPFFQNIAVLAIAGLVIGSWGVISTLDLREKCHSPGFLCSLGLLGGTLLFFLGLTAGAFLITILTYVFRIKIFRAIGPLSAFTVLVTIICEMIIISLDLGHVFGSTVFLSPPASPP